MRHQNDKKTVDEMWKYPCPCGGTPLRKIVGAAQPFAHRVPDEQYAGERCGGTVMLIIGEDNARQAYGIRGQHIAVYIVH